MLTTPETVARTERRYSERWATDKKISWRLHRGRTLHQSRLVERSLNGMVILTSEKEAPRLGASIHPRDRHMCELHGFRVALVTRVEPVPGGSLVYTEILA